MKSLEEVHRRSLISPTFLQSQDLGEITPAFYRSGPTQTRSCTDVLCCLIFWFIAVCLLIINILAFCYGDPQLIYVGYDETNNACGVGDYENYPYLYFYNTKQNSNGMWATICVSECPSEGDTSIACGVNTIITDCSDSDIIIYDTYPYMGFICLPTNITVYEEIESALTVTGIAKVLLEIWNNWELELISMGFAYVLGMISIFMIIYTPHTVIIFFIIFVFLGLLGFGSILIIAYADPYLLVSEIETESNAAAIITMLSDVSDEFRLIAGIIFMISAFIFLLCMIIFNKKIKLLMIMLKSTGLFIKARKSFTFISFVFFLVLSIYLFVWTIVLLYLWTWSDDSEKTYYETPFEHFETSSIAIIFLVVHVVSFFWNVAFILATYTFLLNSSCVYWYFSHNPDSEEYSRKLPHPLRLALKLYFRYHFGSVAQGAILLLLFRGFNSTFGYFYNKITNYGRETQNKCSQFTIKTCVCFMYCYEKVFRYITRDAFVEMALTGKNFLKSSRDTFYLIKRSDKKYSMVEGLGHLVFWLGKLYICLLTSFLSFIASLEIEYFSQNVTDPLIPLLVVMVLSFLLGNVIMNLLSTITETLILIYLVDEEIEIIHYNEKRPHSAPEELHEFMRETLKELNKDEDGKY